MNTRKDSYSKGTFYDLDRVKQISIEDVCRNMLGIPTEKRNGRIWCKARAEKEASTILHMDRNTFYDFGTQEHGDVVHFVSYVLGIPWKDALDHLAAEYHIPAENRGPSLCSNDLSNREYEKIGLAGDLATKNFEYGEHLSIARMKELYEKYAMPLSDLRRKHPKTYERILRQKAIPYVWELRTDYFLEVWRKHLLVESLGCPELFSCNDILDDLKKQSGDLETAERLLSRAVKGTSLRWTARREYDPEQDLVQLKAGKITPRLGSVDRRKLQEQAEKQGSPVLTQTVDYLDYVTANLEDIPHSASFRSGQVLIEYLELDESRLGPILDKICREKEKPSLTSRLSSVTEEQVRRPSQDHSVSVNREL